MGRLEDVALAKTLCDPYLQQRVHGQGLDATPGGPGELIYRRGALLAQGLMIQNTFAKLTAASPQYWYNIGEKNLAQSNGAGLWCDGSAGMIMSLLATNPQFKSCLEVIKQGDPVHHGHWWVIANRPNGADLDYDKPLHKDCFVLDIWGAIRGRKASSVGDPPYIFYDCGSDKENVLVSVCRVAQK